MIEAGGGRFLEFGRRMWYAAAGQWKAAHKMIKEIFSQLLKFVPAHVLRLVAGSIVLGVILMLFLKVVDDVFDLPPAALTWVGVAVTVLFALLLCWKAKVFSERCLHFGVGLVMIFSVGLASNNVIAELRGNFGPDNGSAPTVPNFDEIILSGN